MWRSIFVLSLTVLMACNDPQKRAIQIDDLVRLNLNSNVRELTDSFFVMGADGFLHPDSVKVQHISFLDGFIDNMYTIDINGQKTTTIFKTMPDGRWISVYTTKNSRMIDSTSFQLNEAGKYARAIYYDSSRNVTETHDRLKENDFFLITEGEVYDPGGTPAGSFIKTYDQQNQTSSITKNASGQTKLSQTFTLNKHGDPEEEKLEIFITDRQSIDKSVSYRYDNVDPSGNWMRKEERDNTGKILKVTKRNMIYVGGR